MEISKRLEKVASFVSYPVMADIGTDHGYVPIYLHKMGRVEKALACDVNKGPLEKAKTNIALYKAEDVIEPRLGSGLTPVSVGEVQSAVIAGMGGMLTIKILEDSPEVVQSLEELVLSPQQDVEEVRRYLHKIGFTIHAECMMKEDEKYYNIMQCKKGAESYETVMEYRFGKQLLLEKNSILLEYLQLEEKKHQTVIAKLEKTDTENAKLRLAEVQQQMKCVEEAIAWLQK